nr:hypothetical protein Iba_chr04eCG17200 [Ipomoea batatas]
MKANSIPPPLPTNQQGGYEDAYEEPSISPKTCYNSYGVNQG